jgi:hypothetical protein
MRTKQTSELISDEQSLVSAQFSHGTPIQTYDDGYGPLYILRNSMGVQGIIRAQTWEDAYEIAEDEMFDDCDLTMDEIVKEYGFRVEYVQPYSTGQTSREETPDAEAWPDNPLFQEAYGFRPNGARDHSKPMSHIYAKDLNGESLDILTPELVAELGIQLNIQTNE